MMKRLEIFYRKALLKYLKTCIIINMKVLLRVGCAG
jgi:hypothetical protein